MTSNKRNEAVNSDTPGVVGDDTEAQFSPDLSVNSHTDRDRLTKHATL